jgi:hypothetical protein
VQRIARSKASGPLLGVTGDVARRSSSEITLKKKLLVRAGTSHLAKKP